MNIDDDFDIQLNTEWIQEFEKMVEEHIHYPHEPMSSLCIHSLFIENNSIVHVSTKLLSLEKEREKGGYRNLWEIVDTNSKELYWMDWIKKYTEFIGSEKALEQEKIRLEKRAKQFSLSDVLLFNVDIDVGSDEKEMDYSTLGKCFRGYSLEEWKNLGELEWKDSVFLFHSINAVYFVFRENPVFLMEVDDLVVSGGISLEMPVSILVSPGIRPSSCNKTRKVCFDDGLDSDMDSDVDSDVDSDSTEEEWGKGNWLKKRKRNRRKTEKRKHVFSPALIRSLFTQT